MYVSPVSTTMLIRLCGILKPHNGILAQFKALLKFFISKWIKGQIRSLPAHGWKALFGQYLNKYALLGSAGGHHPHEAGDKEEQRSH